MTDLDRRDGSSAFGQSPKDYDTVRPDYPIWMWELLRGEQCLFPGVSTVEIGPGTGLATRALITGGAAPLTLIEPDKRFAPYLDTLRDARGSPCNVIYETFESATLLPACYELVVAATAYHWLDPATRAASLARVLKSGGVLALMWHVFQNPNLADPFHNATTELLSQLPDSPSGAPDTLPFALDRNARERELTAHGQFSLISYQQQHWPLILTCQEVRSLYGGFSGLSRLSTPARTTLLDELERIASEDFDNAVTRNMTSVIYLFRRT